MNVFVLNTGRCGSVTFDRACRHITNYSSGHESRTRELGEERLRYPPNHIEADNRLSWFLGRLDQEYGDNAFYVHLMRDEEETAQSYARRFLPGHILRSYYEGILMYLNTPGIRVPNEPEERIRIARDYCNTVNTNISLFLKDKTHKMTVQLETAETDFVRFWSQIGAEGDLEAALAEWRVTHNASTPDPPWQDVAEQRSGAVFHAVRRAPRVIRSLIRHHILRCGRG